MIDARKTSRRLAVTVLAVFLIVAAFIVRLVDIQVVRAAELQASADATRTRAITTYGVRGAILDRDGTVLADSVERYDIVASPDIVGEETWITRDGERVKVPTIEAVQELAEATGADAGELLATLMENPQSKWALLVKGVALEVFDAVRGLEIGWISSELRPARAYPNGALAGNLVGFIGTDGPLAGIELRHDECLAATQGESSYQAGADGVRLPGTTVVTTPAEDGGDIRLTIDADLQWYVQQVLAEHATALGADWATGFVVRVSDGHIMAAADYPAIDPNDLDSVDAVDAGARSFAAPYEPGSIMKPATFASLLDAGLVAPGTQLTVPGRYTQGLPAGTSIKDAWAHSDVRLTATGVLVNSSNVGTSMLSSRMPASQRYDYLRTFGLGERTAADFLGESAGLLWPTEQADVRTELTQQFGQGMSATSAQIAAIYQTLGNGGVRMPLTLVAGCELPDGTMTQQPSTQGTRVVSESAADTVLQMLEQVVTQGSLSSVLQVPGYRIAAKTGTAEVAGADGYTSDRIVSVAGVVYDDDRPEYAIAVTFAKPDTMRTSAAAAPAFHEVAQQVIKAFRIAPSSQPAPRLALTW